MSRWLCVALTLTALSFGPSATACPCSDDAGGGTSLVRADETYAVALLATSRHALGRFDARGNYRPLGADESESSEELLLRAGLRLPRRFEWLAELGAASYRFHAGRIVEERDGIGDAVVRARYSLLEESMPHESPHLPALALSGLLRAPLGALSRGGGGSFGSGGAQLGLGAWEAGVGFDLSRALLTDFDLSFAAEGAYRFEDHALGKARRLGPRAEAMLGARLQTTSWLATSLALRARATGDVEYAERSLPGTAERLLTVSLGGAVYDRPSGFRASLTLSLDPPVGAFSRASTAATALGVSLGYGAF